MTTSSAALLAAELRQTDPSVPFRASSSHTHHTWAKTFYSLPELYIQPESIEEVQKIVTLARRCRKRLVTVGSGHSPNDLTCTSSWMVNLDRFEDVLDVDQESKRIRVQAGIRLHAINERAALHGLTIPNLGSIDEQSIAGAIATGTHGSSMFHGTLSQNVVSLKIVLGDGSCANCSVSENEELFRAALCSLGALGIIVEVEYQLVADRKIEWVQTSMPLDDMLAQWEGELWSQAEFTRIWWLPYMRRVIVWRANETDKDIRPPQSSWYGGLVGYHMYKTLLGLAHFVPRILPFIEWFVFGMQYGFTDDMRIDAVENQRDGLLMNCLYSQYVNEWACPISNGPKAIRALDAWIQGEADARYPRRAPNSEPMFEHLIPSAPRGLRVHAPIEVRISNTTLPTPSKTRPYLDQSCATEPTLYLNATLYRPYGFDPPCRRPYYRAFESILAQLNGRPHWAKNFLSPSKPSDLHDLYDSDDLQHWRYTRARADPDGVFVGDWHRRLGLVDGIGAEVNAAGERNTALPCEERVTRRLRRWLPWSSGGVMWYGRRAAANEPVNNAVVSDSANTTPRGPRSVAGSSEESFEVWSRGEVEESGVLVEKE